MKQLALILVGVFMAATVMSQSTVESLLKRYNNNDDVIAFNLNGNLMNLFESVEGAEEIKSKVDNLSVLLFKKGDDISAGDRQKLKGLVKTQGYEPLINAKHEDGKIKIYAIDGGDFIERLYAELTTDEHNVYLSVKGKIHYEDITKLNVDELASKTKIIKD